MSFSSALVQFTSTLLRLAGAGSKGGRQRPGVTTQQATLRAGGRPAPSLSGWPASKRIRLPASDEDIAWFVAGVTPIQEPTELKNSNT